MGRSHSWPEDDVPFLYICVKHLILMEVGTADHPRDSIFIPMCNKRYISKPKNKEIGSVSGKTDSLMSFFSAPHFSG